MAGVGGMAASPRPQGRGRSALKLLGALVAAAAAVSLWDLAVSEPLPSCQDAAFVNSAAERHVAMGRPPSRMAMKRTWWDSFDAGFNFGNTRRTHIRFQACHYLREKKRLPRSLVHLMRLNDIDLRHWSQLLKVVWKTGEEDLVSESDLREHFTTADYEPKGVMIGYKTDFQNATYGLVYFDNHDKAKQARKEKMGGKIGDVEYDLKYRDDRLWMRARDGITEKFTPRLRGYHMKAYGDQTRPGEGADAFQLPWGETGARTHMWYPE